MKSDEVLQILNRINIKFEEVPDFQTYKENRRLQHLAMIEISRLTKEERRDIITAYLNEAKKKYSEAEIEHYLRWLKILIP